MPNSLPQAVYRFKDALYINLTNSCPNACVFCLKNPQNMRFGGHNLDLAGQEPAAAAVLGSIRQKLAQQPASEIVFCGYGEPTMRLDTLLTVATSLKKDFPHIPLRLNTVGLANLVHGRDITGDLAQVLDKINISLNSPDAAQWAALVRPAAQYAQKGFQSVLDFTRLAAQKLPGGVTVSIVANQNVDAAAAQKLAQELGAKFYQRDYIDDK